MSEHDEEAAKHRAEQQETLRKADEVDPYVTTTDAADASDTGDAGSRDTTAADVRYDRVDGERYTADGAAATTPAEPAITRAPATTTGPAPSVTGHDDPVIADAPPLRRDGADRV